MSEVQLRLDDDGRGAFEIREGDEVIGEMVVGIRHASMLIYHTGVVDRMKGKGYADKLFHTMVDYARAHKLKVNPRCAYVDARFKRQPAEYADIWSKD